MPSAVKLLALLLGLGAILAAGSLEVQRRQARAADRATAQALTGGDPRAGRAAIQALGCGACHAIPGVPRADGRTGPPLGGVAVRPFLAGSLRNDPTALQLWIRHPQTIEPEGGMPEMGVSEGQARDIAAYLYTLR